jgi:hypothetical protein
MVQITPLTIDTDFEKVVLVANLSGASTLSEGGSSGGGGGNGGEGGWGNDLQFVVQASCIDAELSAQSLFSVGFHQPSGYGPVTHHAAATRSPFLHHWFPSFVFSGWCSTLLSFCGCLILHVSSLFRVLVSR